MGPQHAAHIFKTRYPSASRYEVTLYGSLAATGKGHMTDVAITEELRLLVTSLGNRTCFSVIIPTA